MAFVVTKKKQLLETPEKMLADIPLSDEEKNPSAERKENNTVRISFRMGKSLHKRLKLAAVMQGRSIVSVLEGFVAEYTPAV